MKLIYLAAALALPLVASCTSATQPTTDVTQQSAVSLQNSTWKILTVDGNPIVDANGAMATGSLSFTDESVSVSAGCNRLGGSFTAGNGFMDVGPMISTRKACPPPLMAQDQTLSMLLQAAEDYQMAEDGTLKINGSKGSLTAAPASE